MKIDGNEIRPGNVIEHQNRLWRAVKTQHVKPGKGGAFLQVELKDIRDGTKLNERFRSAETVERVRLEQKEYQFLFSDGDAHTFMDQETFEQVTLGANILDEEQSRFLQDGMVVQIEFYEEEALGVALPERGNAERGRGRPGREGPDGDVVLQARDARQRRAHPGAAAHRGRHRRGGEHCRRHLRRARARLT